MKVCFGGVAFWCEGIDTVKIWIRKEVIKWLKKTSIGGILVLVI